MDLLQLLRDKSVVLVDGAMGTELDRYGLMLRGSSNLDAPQAVLEIHRAYAQSGCDALTTNTLTANPLYVETHNVGVSVPDVNRAAVELARQAAGGDRRVLGNIGPTGQLMEPYGTFRAPDFLRSFSQQATVLAEAGVDGFLIETMFDLREALCALGACKEISTLPVIVSMAFQTDATGGRTMMGDAAEQCARQLTDAGADVVGANCGDLDPDQMANVVAILRSATHLPIVAQPNAGRPRLVGDKAVFEMGPEPFARGIGRCIEAGAQLVGGCCGTTPEHIRAVRRQIDDPQGAGEGP
jgi:5-methyltetrahydrofolate--homocysteine methyltransferase